MYVLVAQSCPTLCDPVGCVDCQAPLCMEFSRKPYWRGWPLSFPGDLPNPGIESGSPVLQEGSFFHRLSHQGSPSVAIIVNKPGVKSQFAVCVILGSLFTLSFIVPKSRFRRIISLLDFKVKKICKISSLVTGKQ